MITRRNLTVVANRLMRAAAARWEAEGFGPVAPDDLGTIHYNKGVEEALRICHEEGWTAAMVEAVAIMRTSSKWVHTYFTNEYLEGAILIEDKLLQGLPLEPWEAKVIDRVGSIEEVWS